MAIAKGYEANFDTLVEAIRLNDVCLLECKDRVTGLPVIVICAANRAGEEVELVPLAKMFDGNPYDQLISPMEEEA